MVYTEAFYQPSILELARLGNFQAITYLINTYLNPQGISAWVQANSGGCLQILVEVEQEPVTERLVRFICHELWKLNSPAVEGVNIVARFPEGDVLWKRSVRIITPANRARRRLRLSLGRLKLKTLRFLLLMGSAVASLIIGSWISYHEALASRPLYSQQAALVSPRQRPDAVKTALETVPVIRHEQVMFPNDPTVTLMFGGDVTLGDALVEEIGEDYQLPLANLDPYRQADWAMVNLDHPLTQATKARPDQSFPSKADPDLVNVLTAGGIDMVNLANNHIMDYEGSGLVETLKTLEDSGIYSIGAGRDLTEARRPQIVEVKGQRIAYLGYYDTDIDGAGQGVPGINPLQEEQVAEDIQAIRDQVDWVIVNYHWGVELSNYPANWQMDLARFTIDVGADLVVGHHPRVLQGAEIYKGRPIVYSLGSFIFGSNARSQDDTAVLRVSLKNRQMKLEFLPIAVQNHQAQVAQGEKGKEILKQISRLSSIFDQPMTTPMVLEAPATVPPATVPEPSTDLEMSPSAPRSPQLPQFPEDSHPVNPTPRNNPPVSFPIHPRFRTEQPTPITEEEEVMTPPVLNPPMTPTEETDPFIKEPFIKDPFFEMPVSPTSQGVPENPPAPNFPSFTLSRHRRPVQDIAVDPENRVTRTPIQLPVFPVNS